MIKNKWNWKCIWGHNWFLEEVATVEGGLEFKAECSYCGALMDGAGL